MHTDIRIGETSAYYSTPNDSVRHPGLILIEEIWGVNAHIRDVADRFAREGFVVLAPEILPRETLTALTPDIPQKLFDPETRAQTQPLVRAALAPIDQPAYAQQALATLSACVDHLAADARTTGTVVVVGFCFGGSYCFHLAAHDTRINAAVPFYGQPPTQEEVTRITCPILAFYGDRDEGIMATLPTLREQMQGKQFEAVVYENARHAFFNDTNPHTYHPHYAHDAWEKTLAFLHTHTRT